MAKKPAKKKISKKAKGAAIEAAAAARRIKPTSRPVENKAITPITDKDIKPRETASSPREGYVSDKVENDPNARGQFEEVMKERALSEIGQGHLEPREPGFAAGLVSAQQAREKREARARETGNIVSAGELEASAGAERPEPATLSEEARLEKERAANTRVPGIGTRGRGSGTGILRPGTAPKPVRSLGNVNEGPAGENNIKRLQKGMGIAGEENGELEAAVNIRHRELLKTDPNAPRPSTTQVAGGEEHRIAKVMNHLGISEETLRSDVLNTGMNFQNRLAAIHGLVQSDRDSKITEVSDQEVGAGDFWEHPRTGELHRVADNHPDMPKVFTVNKGLTITYSRNKMGQIQLNPKVKEGWNREDRSGGYKVWKLRTAPANNGKVIDYIRNAYQNPESSKLKAGSVESIRTLLGGSSNGVEIRRAAPNLAPVTSTFTKEDDNGRVISDKKGNPVQFKREDPIALVEPRRIAPEEAGEGEQAPTVKNAGMPSSGIPEGRTGLSRVRRVAPKGAVKRAAAAARTRSLFAGPHPEEAAGQMAFDFDPTGKGKQPRFTASSSGTEPEYTYDENGVGTPKPAPVGKKQITVSSRGSKIITQPAAEPTGMGAAIDATGVGLGERVQRVTIHPDTHKTLNITDNTRIPEPSAPQGGYEQPELPLYSRTEHREGKQWDMLGGKIENTAARGLGRTTSPER